jgi:hypothetical protein
MQNWFSYRYFIASYLFLIYFYNLSYFNPAKARSTIVISFLVNLAIWIFLLIFASQFDSSGLLYTAAQKESGRWYNGYLIIGDTLLFLSLGLVACWKNYLSLLSLYLTTFILLFLGSRASVVPALLSLIPVSLVLLKKLFTRKYFFPKVLLSKLNIFKKRNILTLTLILTIVFISVNFNLFQKFEETFSIKNLYQSRIYQSFIESSAYGDQSFQARSFMFQCFYRNFLLYPEKILLGTDSDMGCQGVNYLHSTLSVFVDLGLIGFLPFMYLISIVFKKIISYYKTSKLEFIMLIIFLILGFSSRSGFGLLLPTLTFVYSLILVDRNERHCTVQSESLVRSVPMFIAVLGLTRYDRSR